MDHNRLINSFSEEQKEFLTNLSIKLSQKPILKKGHCFCLWSDLLGFGNVFSQNNWILSNKNIWKVYKRLADAHLTAIYYSDPRQRILILNDGIAKTFHPNSKDDINNVLGIATFLRDCIMTHISICTTEYEKGLPGCRSVLSFGENYAFTDFEIRYDDYVFNYSKPKGNSLSLSAQRLNNPLIVHNPADFQMNTAFSKAYILESGGSKHGLKGDNFFIAQDAINAIIKYSEEKGHFAVWVNDSEGMKLFIAYDRDNLDEVVMGFCFSSDIIHFENERLKTNVYTLLKFYPWDEKTSEFHFDILSREERF